MAQWLLQHEGLFVGSSSAMNVVAACRVAKRLPADSVIVTGTSIETIEMNIYTFCICCVLCCSTVIRLDLI